MNGKLIPKIIAQYKKIALIKDQKEACREEVEAIHQRNYLKREKLEKHPELLAIKEKIDAARRPFRELSKRSSEIESLLGYFEKSLETKSGPEFQYSDLLIELYEVSQKMKIISEQENPAENLEKEWCELRAKLSGGIDEEYRILRNLECTLEINYDREFRILQALKDKFLNS